MCRLISEKIANPSGSLCKSTHTLQNRQGFHIYQRGSSPVNNTFWGRLSKSPWLTNLEGRVGCWSILSSGLAVCVFWCTLFPNFCGCGRVFHLPHEGRQGNQGCCLALSSQLILRYVLLIRAKALLVMHTWYVIQELKLWESRHDRGGMGCNEKRKTGNSCFFPFCPSIYSHPSSRCNSLPSVIIHGSKHRAGI